MGQTRGTGRTATRANPLKDWRTSRGLTQTEAARVFGISLTGYAKIEHRLRRPRAKLAKIIMKRTGIDAGWLLGV